MSLSIVQTTSSFSAVLSTTRSAIFPAAVTAGNNVIVATASRYTILSVTDSQGNTYVRDKNAIFSGGAVSIWRCFSVTGGNLTVTVSHAGFAGSIMMTAEEVSGSIQLLSAYSATGTSTTPNAGEITPAAQETYIILSLMAGPLSTALLTPNNFTSRIKAGTWPWDIADEIAAAGTAPFTPTWAINLMRTWVACAGLYAEPTTPLPPPPPADGVAGVPENLFTRPDYPLGPPILGAPWWRPILDPPVPPPDVTVRTPAKPFLVPQLPLPVDSTRLEDSMRRLITILNSLSRQQFLFQNDQGFQFRGAGFDQARAPGEADDSSIGVRVGAVWLDGSTDPAGCYVCSNATVGGATWLKLKTISSVPKATGSFP